MRATSASAHAKPAAVHRAALPKSGAEYSWGLENSAGLPLIRAGQSRSCCPLLMHTHYDNLKVSRDAPFEVIRAAYKSLSQKYHPDRHADGEESNRIMRLINAAYEVLSDPVRRDEHDRWIVVQERLEASQRGRRPAAATAPRPGAGVPPRPTAGAARARPQAEAQPQTARQERARKAEAEKADKARKEREQAQAREQARARERQREQESREQEAKREADARRRRAERAEQDQRERQRAERDSKESDQRRGPQAGGRTMREDGFQPARLSGRSWSMLVYALAATAIVVLLSDWVPGASLDTPTANAATDTPSTPAAAPAATAPSPTAIAASIISTREETRYLRPALTPKGEPWPERSGYVPGYPVLNTDGLSMVTIDNTRSKFDVFLKLVSTDSTRPLPVRTSYVRSGTSFTMENIAPGSYDVRYRSLDTGEIFRSERFELKEIQEATGTSFAKNILSLYSVEGKARNVSIPEREFP